MSGQKLDELSERLDKTVNRIDRFLERKPSLRSRISSHVRAQGSNILNVVLAGCVLSVAIGRLVQQHRHEEERQVWEEGLNRLETENTRLQRRLSEAETRCSLVRGRIQEELEKSGWRLAPVASRITDILSTAQSQAASSNAASPQNNVPTVNPSLQGTAKSKLMV